MSEMTPEAKAAASMGFFIVGIALTLGGVYVLCVQWPFMLPIVMISFGVFALKVWAQS